MFSESQKIETFLLLTFSKQQHKKIIQIRYQIMSIATQRRACSYCKNVGHNAANMRCPKKMALITTMYGYWRMEFTNEDATNWINTLTDQEIKFTCSEMNLWNGYDDPAHGIDYHRRLLEQEILRWRRNAMTSIETYLPYMEINDVTSYYLEQYIENGNLLDTFYDLPLEKQNFIRRLVYNRTTYKEEHRRRNVGDPNLHIPYRVLNLMEDAFRHSHIESVILTERPFVNPQYVLDLGNDGVRTGTMATGVTGRSEARERVRSASTSPSMTPAIRPSTQRWNYEIQVKEPTESETFDCGICYESTNCRFRAELNCGHTFCFLCIQQQSAKQYKQASPPCCGFCRETIKTVAVATSAMSVNFKKYAKT